ncbi:hypothetical protein CLOM_g22020 [Closterium sp. NIES-68]|nr:hypothetical protein CLOM_g22020 [Closterium sp. NIES-68]GJP64248.1 hypothetical protein CLOP_g21260 [Closterium sp. NIES-67]GJP77799.1 hypothetical protein CLOP_g8142 [Closterium sp. NIES-67]
MALSLEHISSFQLGHAFSHSIHGQPLARTSSTPSSVSHSSQRLTVQCGRHAGSLRRPKSTRRKAKPARSADAQRAGKGGKGGGGASLSEEVFSLGKGWLVDPAALIGGESGGAEGRGGADGGRATGAGTRGGNEAVAVAGLDGRTRSTHKLLKIFSGTNRGRRLLSPADRNVRPMMEMVRAAVFDMLHSMLQSPQRLPANTRWLDLYSGTGSVGLEALSRGCGQAHFVEMDPWVISSVLSPNIQACSFSSTATIHPLKVESFLQQAEDRGADWLGGPFSFISVTPPYELVVYSQLMAQLALSPLLHEDTCMVVEYPLKSRDEILDTCGPLHKIKDRKYGRTNVAIYGPAWALHDIQ